MYKNKKDFGKLTHSHPESDRKHTIPHKLNRSSSKNICILEEQVVKIKKSELKLIFVINLKTGKKWFQMPDVGFVQNLIISFLLICYKNFAVGSDAMLRVHEKLSDLQNQLEIQRKKLLQAEEEKLILQEQVNELIFKLNENEEL